MIILGITGPTGAGKTTALQRIAARGGVILDLDAVYHRLLETNPSLLSDLSARFPAAVQHGRLDRKALGAIVFSDPEALQDLNAITGRYILAETDRLLQAAQAQHVPLAAIDAINLLSGDLPGRCDFTVAVTAPEEIRVRRIMARDGISESYARSRVAAQPPNDYFSRRCDFTLHNNYPDQSQFAAACDALLDQILPRKEAES